MMSYKSYALLGASRGLGRAFLELLLINQPASTGLVLSRKAPKNLPETQNWVWQSRDFTQVDGLQNTMRDLHEFAPEVVIYFAGGGPHGLYADKSWRDHEWAWRVSFLAPAQVLHGLLALDAKKPKQFIVVGSSVAESTPDPQAASYAAAKHALKGLVTTISSEYPSMDIRLFSPGYMLTDLLPSGSAPRTDGRAIHPENVAKSLWSWHLNPNGPKHLVL